MALGNTYWSRRAIKDKAGSVNRTEAYIMSEQKKMYTLASLEIQEEVEKLYQTFADQENISLAEAKTYLKNADFNKIDFRGMAEESLSLKEKLKNSSGLPEAVADVITQQHSELERKIRTYSKKGRISYLELRLLAIDKKLVDLYDSQQVSIYDLLQSEWEDGYYRTIYNIQHFIGFGKDFTRPNERVIERAILNTFDKKNYSKRLYRHCSNFSKDLKESLITGLIRGENLDKMASHIQKRMDVSYSRAKTLVRSETAYLYESSTMAGYEESGIEWYEFMATLDKWTSEMCQAMDGKHFRIKDAVPGINYPPLHPNCRSTTVCWFPEEEVKELKRIAKDSGGRYYTVPADMTYKEWDAKYGKQQDIRAVKKKVNKQLDKMTELKTPVGLSGVPFAKTIRNTVTNSPSDAARVLEKYYDDIKISNMKVHGTAHYDPGSKVIRYNADRDYRSARGKFSTLFHECGHMVDDLSGRVSELEEFRQALLKDNEEFLKKLQRAGGYATIEEVYEYLRYEMDKPVYYAVRDLLDGINDKAITQNDRAGHPRKYWQRKYSLEHEAFAHFFSASILGEEEKLKSLKVVFPIAFSYFEEMLKNVR